MTNETSHLDLVQDVLQTMIRHTQNDTYRVISPEDFARKMFHCADGCDQEDRHMLADNIMCDLLINLGYGKGVKIFKKMEKWYG